jgi:MFS transporter, DHA3 family, macrolide efflux protein
MPEVMTPRPVAVERPAADAAVWRRVGLLLSGQSISLIGDQAFFLAALWTAAQLGGAAAVTWVTLAESVPRALAMVFGGVICDAFGPRLVLMRTTAFRIAALGLAFGIALSTQSVLLLVVVAGLEGLMLGLGTPSFGTLMPRMVPPASLGRANSVRTMVARFAPILGSPFGAWLIANGRLSVALAVTCASCVVSWLCLGPATRSIDAPRTVSSVPLWRRSGDGAKLLLVDQKLRLLFLSGLCLDFAFAWPMNPGLPEVVHHRGWQVYAVALLIACWAAGALVSAGVGALLGERIPLSVKLVGSGFGIAVLLTGMILVPSLPLMAVMAVLLGICSGQNGPAALTLYQNASPSDRLGVSMSMLALSGIGCSPLAYAICGAIASLSNPSIAWLCSALIAFGGPLIAIRALRIHQATPA